MVTVAILPFVIWIIFFSSILGIIKGFETSNKNMRYPLFFRKSKKFYSRVRDFIILCLPILAILFNLSAPIALLLGLGAPLVFYYFHDGFYFFTRGSLDVPEWNWNTTAHSTYIQRFSLSSKVRLTFLWMGIVFYVSTMIVI